MTEEISVGYHDIFKIRSAFGGDFRYDNFNVGGLRFLIELVIFVNARKEGGITSRFLFFKAIFAYLATLELPKQGDTDAYPASAMINVHLFIALCTLNVHDGLLFLSNNPAWCRAIGFVNGVPSEATVSRFRARILNSCR